MSKLVKIKSIRFTGIQVKSLDKLEEYGVNVSQFIRQATKEKIEREWKQIKIKHESKDVCPF